MDGQICLMNELINHSRMLSKEMDVKFNHDLKIIDEMREINRKIFEQGRKLDYIGVKLKGTQNTSSTQNAKQPLNPEIITELNKSLAQANISSIQTPRKVEPSKFENILDSIGKFVTPKRGRLESESELQNTNKVELEENFSSILTLDENDSNEDELVSGEVRSN